jgi:hypothetical protein
MNQWRKGTSVSVKAWAKRYRRPMNSEDQPGEREFCLVTHEGGLWDIVCLMSAGPLSPFSIIIIRYPLTVV